MQGEHRPNSSVEPMITAKFLETMALYNMWQNQTLIDLCNELTPDQRRLDRRMFFGSILNTLNHIIHVDQTIHLIIHTKSFPVFDPTFIPYPDYDEFKRARSEFDETLLRESQTCSQAWLDEVFEFWSETLNRNRRIPRSFFYIQMFNHQTHHRSQITSEFHKLGMDYGCTDLPYNPYYEF